MIAANGPRSKPTRHPESAIPNPHSAIRYFQSPPFFSRTNSSGSVVL